MVRAGAAVRRRVCLLAEAEAFFESGSSPDAVLAGRQPVGQAWARTAQPWQIALAALIWGRPAPPGPIGKNSSGSVRWQAPCAIQPRNRTPVSDGLITSSSKSRQRSKKCSTSTRRSQTMAWPTGSRIAAAGLPVFRREERLSGGSHPVLCTGKEKAPGTRLQLRSTDAAAAGVRSNTATICPDGTPKIGPIAGHWALARRAGGHRPECPLLRTLVSRLTGFMRQEQGRVT